MKKFIKIIFATVSLLLAFNPIIALALVPTPVNQGGTGVNTITGIIQGNGTSPFSAITVGSGLNFAGGTLSATGAGTVTSVSGTANRITSTGGTTPVLDISGSYVGQSSITTLGTIGTGIWNGTSIGTGFTDAKVVSVSCTTITCSGTNPATFSIADGAIGNAKLTNSTISGISLGSNLNALTATDSSLTFSGSYNGSTARTVGLNLGNANTWTAKQTFNTTAPRFGTITGSTQCLHVDTNGDLSGTGSDCGSGSGGVATVASADGSITVTGTTAIDLAVVKAPILTTARTIGGVSFDGSANIVPQTIQSTNEATDTTAFPLFINSSGSQSLQPHNNAGFTYNSNTNALTATTFIGALTGNSTTATALATGRTIAITGDLAYTSPSFDGSGNVTAAGTLATVNANVGSFGSATQTGTFTVNGKGLITAASNTTITPAVGSITGLGSGVATWLATPSSANLITAVTDETGSGALVFGTTPTLATPVINGLATGTGVASGATASTLVSRDSNANITANNWLGGYTTTATAAGTTTLTVASTYLQFFTGSTTQTVTLPVVSTLALGTQYIIVNNSTGAVTVNSSGANAVVVLAGGTSTTVTSIATSGTTAAVWSSGYVADSVASGKKLTVNNTLTLSGTDGSTLNIGTGGTLGTAAYTASSAYEVPLTFSTGLTRSTNTITVNTSQNIATLSNLTSNGLVTTSGGAGTLGITAMGSGIATWLGTPSSANLITAMTDETGTGALVFANTPTLVTPALGAATYTTLSGGNITDSGLTATRATFAGTAGLLSDDGGFLYASSTDQLTLGEAGQDGSLKIFAEDGATDHSTIFQPGTQTQDITYTLPVDDGTSTQVLTTDGAGVLSWATPTASITPTSGTSGGPATSSTQTITHGLGRTPVVIRIYGLGRFGSSTNAFMGQVSMGIWTAASTKSVSVPGDGNGGTSANPTRDTNTVHLSDGNGASATGIVGNVGATSFDIVWSLSGSSLASTGGFLWEAQ